MPADYHSHTPLCQHAEGEPEEYVQAAIEANSVNMASQTTRP